MVWYQNLLSEPQNNKEESYKSISTLYPDDCVYNKRQHLSTYTVNVYEVFQHTWEFENVGTQTWRGRKLYFENHGEVRPRAKCDYIAIPEVPPHKSVIISVDMDARGFEGRTECKWVCLTRMAMTLAKQHGKNVSIHLFGQEINPETYVGNILDCRYEITFDGGVIAEGTLDFSVPPMESVNVCVPLAVECFDRETYIRFVFTAKNDMTYCEKGYDICFDQIMLCGEDTVVPDTECKCETEFEDTALLVNVIAGDTEYRFNKRLSAFDSIKYRGAEILDKPLQFNFFRAPVDKAATASRGNNI